MAKDGELELDPDGDDTPKGKGKLIIIIVVALLLIGGGVAMFLGGGGSDADEKEENDDHSDDSHVAEVKPAHYMKLDPTFVVNFESVENGVTYLQVDMQLMARDEAVLDIVAQELPRIRDRFLDILGSQKYSNVKLRGGKIKLQQELLVVVQEIVGEVMKHKLEQESEKEVKLEDVPNVEKIYFTSFIMQ